MIWNYRVIHHGDCFAIHEVYYNDDGKPTVYTENPVGICADKVEDFKEIFLNMQKALEELILTSKDFE